MEPPSYHQHTTSPSFYDTHPLFPFITPSKSSTMIEPIHPNAYLAIASAAHNRITKHKNNQRAKKSAKFTRITTANSNHELSSLSSIPPDDLLAHEGLELNEAGYIQFCPDSPTHPRAWSKPRKVYNLILIISLNFVKSAMSNAGTPIASYAMGYF